MALVGRAGTGRRSNVEVGQPTHLTLLLALMFATMREPVPEPVPEHEHELQQEHKHGPSICTTSDVPPWHYLK